MKSKTALLTVSVLSASGLGLGCASLLGIDGDYDDQASDAGSEQTPESPGALQPPADDDGPIEPSEPEPGAGGSPELGSAGNGGSSPGAGGNANRGGAAGDTSPGAAGDTSGLAGNGSGGAAGGNGATGGAGGTHSGGRGGAGSNSGGENSATGGFAGSTPIAGAGGAPEAEDGIRLRGVQSGGAVVESGNLSASVTISPVDPGRSFLVFGSRFDSTSASFTEFAGNLTDATTVTFERAASSNAAPDVPLSFYVAEFESGVRVQRGSQVLAQPTQQVALGSSIDPSKSVPLVTLRNAGADYSANDFVRAEFTSASELTLSTRSAMSSGSAEWQIISFEDDSTRVYSATVTLPADQTTLDVELAQSVDVARSWLVMTYELVDASQAARQMLVRGSVSASNQLSFERAAAGPSIQITYYLVEFGGSTQVQSGTRLLAGSESTATVSLDEIDLSKSIAVANGSYQRTGSTLLPSGVNLGYASFSLTLGDGPELTLSRQASGSDASLDWSVISFP